MQFSTHLGIVTCLCKRSEIMDKKEIVDLFHRLGKDANLTEWNCKDDSIYVYEDFWKALSELLAALGLKTLCPLCKDILTKEQEHE